MAFEDKTPRHPHPTGLRHDRTPSHRVNASAHTTRGRSQSAAEEIANSLSHGIGFVLAAASLPLLADLSHTRVGRPLHTLGVMVFAVTTMLLYLSSALHLCVMAGSGLHCAATAWHS